MPEIKIEISFDWQPKQTDLSECDNCRDVIFSTMWNMVVRFNDEKEIETKIHLCQSCYESQK